MNDVAVISQHDHHAESGFAVRPIVFFAFFFTLLQNVPFIMSRGAEALLHGKSGQTLTTTVLKHTITNTPYVSICLDPVHEGFFFGWGRGQGAYGPLKSI